MLGQHSHVYIYSWNRGGNIMIFQNLVFDRRRRLQRIAAE